MKLVRVLVLSALLGLGAEGATRSGESIRATRRLGAMVGLLSPYPGLLGLTVGFNANSSFRAELGVSRQNDGLSHVTTWATGARLFVPHWNLSPWASFHIASVSHSGPVAISGFSRSDVHAYGGIGLEWQTARGFTASVGYHVSTKGQTLSQPMLALGWFFEI